MKRIATLLLVLLAVATSFAQSISYQAVIRDANQQLVVNTATNTTVTVKFTDLYQKTLTFNNVNTNMHGLLTLELSDPSFEQHDWKDATMTVVVKSADNSVTYVNSVDRSVNAVPYALSVNGQTFQNYLNDNHYIKGDSVAKMIRDTAEVLRGELSGYTIKNCDDVMACTDIQHMRDSIQLNRTSINALSARIVADSNRLRQDSTELKNMIDVLTTSIPTVNDNTVTVQLNGTDVASFTLNQSMGATVNVQLQEQMDYISLAADQTTDTLKMSLTQTPKDNFVVKLYVNGVLVGDNGRDAASNVIAVSGKNATYYATKNNNYKLKNTDRIQVVYFY